jgi:prephenate dehydrogenase
VPEGAARPLHRVGIVGLGLIGGSIARDLRARQPDVHLLGIDADDVLDVAYSAGVIDERRASIEALPDVDILVLATPVPAIVSRIGELGAMQFRGLVTDVGSTKRQIVASAASAGLARFIGGHPMAGSDRGGFEQSRIGLFDGRPWFLVTPAAGALGDDRAAVEGLVRTLGAIPVDIDALQHDRTVAHVSHLPQLLAVALMNTAAEACGESGVQSAGRAFGEMTRLARSPADLWKGIVETNRDCIEEALRDLIRHLEPLIDHDTSKLDEAFAAAARRRQYIV